MDNTFLPSFISHKGSALRCLREVRALFALLKASLKQKAILMISGCGEQNDVAITGSRFCHDERHHPVPPYFDLGRSRPNRQAVPSLTPTT